MTEKIVVVGQDQAQEPVPIDRIRCFKCRECDHFAKDYLNTQTEKEPEQIQQIHNLR